MKHYLLIVVLSSMVWNILGPSLLKTTAFPLATKPQLYERAAPLITFGMKEGARLGPTYLLFAQSKRQEVGRFSSEVGGKPFHLIL